MSLRINRNTIDWSILRRSRCAPCRNRPGPEAKQPRYLGVLSWEHLWGSRGPECNTRIHPFPRRQTTPVFSSKICRLGELALVLKLSHQPDVRSVGNIAAAVVTSIHQDNSTGTV